MLLKGHCIPLSQGFSNAIVASDESASNPSLKGGLIVGAYDNFSAVPAVDAFPECSQALAIEFEPAENVRSR